MPINQNPMASTHNISELANVCLGKFKFGKGSTFEIINRFLSRCSLSNCTYETHLFAEILIKKRDFQLFDTIIVASALEANCKILYTEDMAHGLIIENQLEIKNLFI